MRSNNRIYQIISIFFWKSFLILLYSFLFANLIVFGLGCKSQSKYPFFAIYFIALVLGSICFIFVIILSYHNLFEFVLLFKFLIIFGFVYLLLLFALYIGIDTLVIYFFLNAIYLVIDLFGLLKDVVWIKN